MNKRTKALVAGGAGAVILLGTAGTFALWSDTATVPGAVVTGGKLALTGNSNVTWAAYDISGDTAAKIADEDDTIQLVAGVELVGETAITPELAGDYLKAELDVTQASTVPAWLDVEWKIGEKVVATGSDSVVIEPKDTGADKKLSVSIKLKDQDAPDTDGDDVPDGIDLTEQQQWTSGDFTVTLQQLAPSTGVTTGNGG